MYKCGAPVCYGKPIIMPWFAGFYQHQFIAKPWSRNLAIPATEVRVNFSALPFQELLPQVFIGLEA